MGLTPTQLAVQANHHCLQRSTLANIDFSTPPFVLQVYSPSFTSPTRNKNLMMASSPQRVNKIDTVGDTVGDLCTSKRRKRWGIQITPARLPKSPENSLAREQALNSPGTMIHAFVPDLPPSVRRIGNRSCLPQRPHEANMAFPVCTSSSHPEFDDEQRPDTAGNTTPASPHTFYHDTSIPSTPDESPFRSYFSDSSVSLPFSENGSWDASPTVVSSIASYPTAVEGDGHNPTSPKLLGVGRLASGLNSLHHWDQKSPSPPPHMAPYESDCTYQNGTYICSPIFSGKARVVMIPKSPLFPLPRLSKSGSTIPRALKDASSHSSSNTPANSTRRSRPKTLPLRMLSTEPTFGLEEQARVF